MPLAGNSSEFVQGIVDGLNAYLCSEEVDLSLDTIDVLDYGGTLPPPALHQLGF